ncbi:MAG: serpin family protein [Chloroflexota bacterium]|nr:serpin family protein [Chloroflexota bacterium]
MWTTMKRLIVFFFVIIMVASVTIGCDDSNLTDENTGSPQDQTGTTQPQANDQDNTHQTGDDEDNQQMDSPDEDNEDEAPIQTTSSFLESSLTRQLSPYVDQSNLDELVSGNTTFALDMYQQLSTEEGNLFFSPYSISIALAMTYAGARNETEIQMADTLSFTLPQEDLHPAFNQLDLLLASRGQDSEGQDGEPFRLNIANAIWGQHGFEFQTPFLDTLKQHYGAGLRLLDFISAPDKSRITINDWVSDQTEEKIKDLLQEGTITSDTRLVLTNAIYFNAAWKSQFGEDLTKDAEFTLLDDSNVTIPMMIQTDHFKYFNGDGFEAVELPYDGNEISMLILLPDPGEFAELENSLDANKLVSTIDELQYTNISLNMPKFENECSFGLRDQLSAMGMPIAFSTAADFSGMRTPSDLFISDVIHKAFISVDEAGTEAAAATAVVMELTAIPEPPIEVSIDRPFIYMIQDNETGSILFLGRVLDPSI